MCVGWGEGGEEGGSAAENLTCFSTWREDGFDVFKEQMHVSLARFSDTAATTCEDLPAGEREALARAAAARVREAIGREVETQRWVIEGPNFPGGRED